MRWCLKRLHDGEHWGCKERWLGKGISLLISSNGCTGAAPRIWMCTRVAPLFFGVGEFGGGDEKTRRDRWSAAAAHRTSDRFFWSVSVSYVMGLGLLFLSSYFPGPKEEMSQYVYCTTNCAGAPTSQGPRVVALLPQPMGRPWRQLVVHQSFCVGVHTV